MRFMIKSLWGQCNAGAILIHLRTRKLSFYNEYVVGFGTPYGEAYMSFWKQETPCVAPLAYPPSLFYRFGGIRLDCYGAQLVPATRPTLPIPEEATLAMVFHIMPGNNPLMEQC